MNNPAVRNVNIVVQEFANEILIYDLKTNKAYCLNETSAMIYQLCDGKKSVAEISQNLTKKLKQPITEDLIWLALDGFKKDNLLKQNDEFEIDFKGMNRRQVIKKIGFASMIALPIISALIAPTAAMAQSGCNGAGCQSTGCVFSPQTASLSNPSTCATSTGFIGSLCNSSYGSQCCSGTAGLKPGSCVDIGPNQMLINCICT